MGFIISTHGKPCGVDIYILSGALTPNSFSPLLSTCLYRSNQPQPRQAQRHFRHEKTGRIIVTVELARQFPEIKGDQMRGQFLRCRLPPFRDNRSASAAGIIPQDCVSGDISAVTSSGRIFAPLLQHAANPCMSILHVIHRVIVAL